MQDRGMPREDSCYGEEDECWEGDEVALAFLLEGMEVCDRGFVDVEGWLRRCLVRV